MHDSWGTLVIPLPIEHHTELFAGLDAWLDWNLVGEIDLQLRIPPRSGSQVTLKLDCTHPRLLEGLGLWQEKGLIDHPTIKQWATLHLSCEYPIVHRAQVPSTTFRSGKTNSFAPDPSLVSPRLALPPSTVALAPLGSKPSQFALFWNSLGAGFSLGWLLFLGVFLVVISSAVLAASQWQSFSPLGQYLVLLSYTLIFAGTSTWASQHQRLHLTANALTLGTLLIIPINFWAMSGLQLARSEIGFVVAILSSSLLSGLGIFLLKKRQAADHGWITLGLWWAQLGWRSLEQLPLPIVASYSGVMACLIVIGMAQKNRKPLDKSFWFLGYAALLLLVRASFFPRISPEQLALAIGIYGFVFHQFLPNRKPYFQFLGVSLIIVSWLLTIGGEPPIQALLISLLSGYLLTKNCLYSAARTDLFLAFGWGAQTLWLAWRLIPAAIRSQGINHAMAWASTDTPIPILGLLWLPYGFLFLWLGRGFRQAGKARLAQQSTQLALGLTVFLNVLTFLNPVTRAWSLTLATLGLGGVSWGNVPLQASTLYSLHFLTIGTFLSHWYLLFPSFTIGQWSELLMGLSVLEGAVCGRIALIPGGQIGRNSAWIAGLALGLMSTLLLFGGVIPRGAFSLGQGALWMLLPGMLLGLSIRNTHRFQRPSRNIALFLLFLTWFFPNTPTRALGLGSAALLLTIPIVHQRSTFLPGVQVLFALGAMVNFLPQREPAFWLNLGGAISLSLGLIPLLWRGRGASIYYRSATAWSMGLALLIFTILTFLTIGNYPVNPNEFIYDLLSRSLPALAMTTLSVGIITWRHVLGFSGLALVWGVALGIAAGVIKAHGTKELLILIFLSVGFLGQGLIQGMKGQTMGQIRPALSVVPLLFTALGTLLRVIFPISYGGGYTLLASVTLVLAGRHHPGQKPLTVLGLLGITYGIAELALATQNYALADAWAIVALVGAVMACGYGWAGPWLSLQWAINPIPIGQLHGVVSAVLLLLMGLFFAPSLLAGKVGAVALVILAIYAAELGKSQAVGVYGAMAATIGALYYTIYWAYPAAGLIVMVLEPYGVTIGCGVALGIFLLPWKRWGWSTEPWNRSAVLLPLAVLALTLNSVSAPSLLMAATFYGWLSHRLQASLPMYLSLFLTLWGTGRLLQQYAFSHPLWYASTIGISSLAAIQFDPVLALPEKRSTRHFLRLLATGVICFTALWESWGSLLLALLSMGIGFGFILMGLGLKTRAYLFLGTATFLATIVGQIILVIGKNALGFWGGGIVAGIAIILAVASVESRREQLSIWWEQGREEIAPWE